VSYRSAEDEVIGFLATIPGLSPEQVSRSAATLLASGMQQFVATEYAGFRQEPLAGAGAVMQEWTLDCELYVAWTDDEQVAEDATALRQNIIDYLARYPTLGSKVYGAEVISGEVEKEPAETQVAKYRRESLRIRVQDQVDYVFAE
jgi:hypothetical protein